MNGSLRHLVVVLAAGAALGGCVTVPTAPAVTALPGSRKSIDQFYIDDRDCRQRAQGALGPYAGQGASDYAVGSAVAGTAIGAAAGAAIGAASGNAGAGAAIGAGTGLLFGSAVGSDVAATSSWSLQNAYDSAYLQCMYARGNQVPAAAGYRAPLPSYPGYRPPPAAGGIPPPSVQPPPSGFPPPNTPPPPLS